jgi:hypothetical protein
LTIEVLLGEDEFSLFLLLVVGVFPKTSTNFKWGTGEG